MLSAETKSEHGKTPEVDSVSGFQITREEIASLFARLDQDQSGRLSEEEFLMIIGKREDIFSDLNLVEIF